MLDVLPTSKSLLKTSPFFYPTMSVPALGTAKQLGNSANLRVSKAPYAGFQKDTTLKTEKSILSFKFFDQGIHLQMVVFPL